MGDHEWYGSINILITGVLVEVTVYQASVRSRHHSKRSGKTHLYRRDFLFNLRRSSSNRRGRRFDRRVCASTSRGNAVGAILICASERLLWWGFLSLFFHPWWVRHNGRRRGKVTDERSGCTAFVSREMCARSQGWLTQSMRQ